MKRLKHKTTTSYVNFVVSRLTSCGFTGVESNSFWPSYVSFLNGTQTGNTGGFIKIEYLFGLSMEKRVNYEN